MQEHHQTAIRQVSQCCAPCDLYLFTNSQPLQQCSPAYLL